LRVAPAESLIRRGIFLPEKFFAEIVALCITHCASVLLRQQGRFLEGNKMNTETILSKISKIDESLNLIEKTWGAMDMGQNVSVHVTDYLRELLCSRNALVEAYSKAVSA
jgi:hypothetical protein